MTNKQCQEGLHVVLNCRNYAFTDINERRANEGKAVIKIMTSTKHTRIHATVRGVTGGLSVREVCFETRPEVQVSDRRIQELLVTCTRCLQHCTDTVQSGRIFGMLVVAIGSSESLVFTDGRLRLRSRSGYGFEVPRPGLPVGATIYRISKVPPGLLLNRRRQLLPQSKAHGE